MLNNWQEEKNTEKENASKTQMILMAKVASVNSEGITLQFAGETAGSKRYKYNRDVSFATGERVLVVNVSGTYVVLCRI